MSSNLSVEEVLANLEEWVVFHREKGALHREREAHHREQRELHEAELEKAQKSLEAFRPLAAAAADLARAPTLKAPLAVPPPGRLRVSRMLRLVVESPGLEEPFQAITVAMEANRRYSGHLDGTIGSRTASDVLRRMLAEGKIRLVREGKGSREALYRRTSAQPVGPG